jgi:hypothetical protein
MSIHKTDVKNIHNLQRDTEVLLDDQSREHLYHDDVYSTTKKVKSQEESLTSDINYKSKTLQVSPKYDKTEETINSVKLATEVKATTELQDNMTRSREIHRQLMNRRNRWKPNDSELTFLRYHFNENSYPTKEEKEVILAALKLKHKSTIDLHQLSRWFQNERERVVKEGNKNIKIGSYKKFSKAELDYLKECFTENTYPKTEDMLAMAAKLVVSLSKIENWYKHNRRSLAKKGRFSLKTKKFFKKDELIYLTKMFDTHPRPSKEQIAEMGKILKCTESQIKNWYSNRRKKQKIIAKKRTLQPQTEKQEPVKKATSQPSPLSTIEPLKLFGSSIPVQALPSKLFIEPNLLPRKILSNTIPLPLVQKILPSCPSLPTVIIPAVPLTSGMMNLKTNTISADALLKTRIVPTIQPKITCEEQLVSTMQYPTYNPNINFNSFAKPVINTANFMGSYPTQMQNPYVIYANKPVYPQANPGYVFTQPNGMQYVTVPTMPNMIPYERPIQIQYLTSLYAPHSNNNIIHSDGYPTLCQSQSGLSSNPLNGAMIGEGSFQTKRMNEMMYRGPTYNPGFRNAFM